MTNGDMQTKIGDWIRQGWELYKANLDVLLVASLLAVLLSIVSVGILGGPMMAGMAWIALALLDKKTPKPQNGDVFRGFDFFLPSFLLFLAGGVALVIVCSILSFVFCVGHLLAILISLVVHSFMILAVFLIVDRRMDALAASKALADVIKPAVLPLLGFMVATALVGALGFMACGVGVFLTMPLAVCVLAVAYRDLFSVA